MTDGPDTCPGGHPATGRVHFRMRPASAPVRSAHDRSTQPGPELADVGRYGRRLVSRFVEQAREADRPRFASMLTEHLGLPADQLPVAEQQWPAYEHVNVQAALDAWLAEPGREHRIVGRGRPPPPRVARLRRPARHDARGEQVRRPAGQRAPHRPAERARRPDPRVPAGGDRAGQRRRHQERDPLPQRRPRAGPRADDGRGARLAGGRRRRDRGAAARPGGRAQRLPRPGGLVRPQHVRPPRLDPAVPPPRAAGGRRADPAARRPSTTYAARSSAWPATATGCAPPGSTSSAGCCSTGRRVSARPTRCATSSASSPAPRSSSSAATRSTPSSRRARSRGPSSRR